ncbi:MAG: A/G-specific adenine glycosylase, partial [Vulcanococcus sp.]
MFALALEASTDQAPVLRQQLLRWWNAAGRTDPAQKPWMVQPDGRWPGSNERIDPYGVLVAEVMLQ